MKQLRQLRKLPSSKRRLEDPGKREVLKIIEPEPDQPISLYDEVRQKDTKKSNLYGDVFIRETISLKKIAEDLMGLEEITRHRKKTLSMIKTMRDSTICQNQQRTLTTSSSSHMSMNLRTCASWSS